MATMEDFIANSSDEAHRQSYFSLSTGNGLDSPNLTASLGNPLKGLMGSPWYYNYMFDSSVPESLEWFYIGWNTLMKGDPDVVGPDLAFDWTELEIRLNETASRYNHAVFTVFAHYPSWEVPLAIPQYLIDAGLPLYEFPELYGSNLSPDYGDPMMLRALEQFITALGAQYDGDTRIGFIHLGLLGFWGEWHTFPHEFVPIEACEGVVSWYDKAFNTTKLHARYPYEPAYAAGFGLSDGSFTTETVGGEANGGVDHWFYFMNAVEEKGMEDFWRRGPMSGETRNDNQGDVFKPYYEEGTYQNQDFMLCVNLTHASYMFHNHAFDHPYEGEELANALEAHVGMGYNFIVSSVAVYASSLNRTVDIDVTIKQIGIAPFYYPLELVLDCPFPWQETQGGVESIIDEGAVRVFSFAGIPSTIDCLNQLSLSLWSTYAYNERPIKFSQGFDGKVMLTVPLPTINQTTAAKHTEAIFNRTTVANITNVPTNQTSSFTNITLTDAKNQSTLAPTPVAPPFQIIPPTTILPTSQIASPTIVVPAIPSARPTRYTAVFPPFPSISMISAVSPIPSLRPTTLPLYARPTVRFNEPELSQDYTKSTDSSSSNLVIPLSMVGLAIFLSILVAFILARRRTHRATYPSEVDLSQDASVDISEGGRKNVPLQMRMH